MFEWIRRRVAGAHGPMYAAIRRVPDRGLPASLTEREGSAEHGTACEASQAKWREAPLRPADDAPLLTCIGGSRQGELLTLELPEGRCLPLFTSPFRAGDYAAARLAQHRNVPVIVSSAAELAQATPGLIESGVTRVAIDICPRCASVAVAGVENLASPDMTIGMRSVALGTRDARRDLYLSEAEACVSRGDRQLARDITLQIVAHVDAEDPRAHWLIGQIAVAERDRGEFREATRFLELLGLPGWCARLDECWSHGALSMDYPPMLLRS